MGDHRAGLAQAEAQLPEKALALTYSQLYAVLLQQVGRQQLAVPQVCTQFELSRGQAQGGTDIVQLHLAQPSRPSRPPALAQSRQALGLKSADPVFHRAPGMAQQTSWLAAYSFSGTP